MKRTPGEVISNPKPDDKICGKCNHIKHMYCRYDCSARHKAVFFCEAACERFIPKESTDEEFDKNLKRNMDHAEYVYWVFERMNYHNKRAAKTPSKEDLEISLLESNKRIEFLETKISELMYNRTQLTREELRAKCEAEKELENRLNTLLCDVAKFVEGRDNTPGLWQHVMVIFPDVRCYESDNPESIRYTHRPFEDPDKSKWYLRFRINGILYAHGPAGLVTCRWYENENMI